LRDKSNGTLMERGIVVETTAADACVQPGESKPSDFWLEYVLRVVLGAQTRAPWRTIHSTLMDTIHAAS
jgi:hypothetical protein